MHLVAIEHFIGVNGGAFSDNGHVLSKSSVDPWVEWEGTKMEPTGAKGYFGYCGQQSQVEKIRYLHRAINQKRLVVKIYRALYWLKQM